MDGPFRWLDGSKWDFTNWDDGEPDRKSPGRSHHEFVQLLLLSLTFCCVLNVVDVVRYGKYCWPDWPCKKKTFFMGKYSMSI